MIDCFGRCVKQEFRLLFFIGYTGKKTCIRRAAYLPQAAVTPERKVLRERGRKS